MKAVPAIAIATRWADFIASPPPRQARPSRSMKFGRRDRKVYHAPRLLQKPPFRGHSAEPAALVAPPFFARRLAAEARARHLPVLRRRSLAVGNSHSHLSV